MNLTRRQAITAIAATAALPVVKPPISPLYTGFRQTFADRMAIKSSTDLFCAADFIAARKMLEKHAVPGPYVVYLEDGPIELGEFLRTHCD